VTQNPKSVKSLRIAVRGVVQGVGFRPFIYRLAQEHKLAGWVRNTSASVEIEVEGEESGVDRFVEEIGELAPPMAKIEGVISSPRPYQGHAGFKIIESRPQPGQYQLVSPDIATCEACRQEVLSPTDRRHRYPFTNCTNCGPRFTIIEDIPYDRPLTTMRQFAMCPDCQKEYDDPLDRRFHAQPNACPVCGPRLRLVDATGAPAGDRDVIRSAAKLLREGKVLAIKGLGGFLLACDATDSQADRKSVV
jgi:hydrogenase maturation protein HypF